mmetsp:Transcript_16758/g.33358  ORF Transcript_16758/g.33358 Transcript_16758/m.33358 type:complete len:111 (-) Transcript_16758:804-1136(-)
MVCQFRMFRDDEKMHLDYKPVSQDILIYTPPPPSIVHCVVIGILSVPRLRSTSHTPHTPESSVLRCRVHQQIRRQRFILVTCDECLRRLRPVKPHLCKSIHRRHLLLREL